MAQKLFKSKKKVLKGGMRFVASANGDNSVIVVGNYKTGQLDWIKKNGVYNWPVREEDGDDGRAASPIAAALASVTELWLYANAKGVRHVFSAAFVGKMTAAEFRAAYPTYAKLGASKQSAYYVFKAKPVDYPPELGSQVVLARTADFGRRCAKVKKAVEQFKRDGEFAPLAAYLPKELGTVPRPQLRVCEAAVQLDFLSVILPVGNLNEGYSKGSIEYICTALGCKHGTPGWPDDFGNSLRMFFNQNSFRRIRTLSLFSGAGGLDIGFSDAGFDIIDSVEIERKFCDTLELNSGDGKRFSHSKVNCVDIRKFSGRDLGRIDFIIGGPPCQTFSAAGRRVASKE